VFKVTKVSKLPKVPKVKAALRAIFPFSSKKVPRAVLQAHHNFRHVGILGTSNFNHFIVISLKRLEGSERWEPKY
jgi:hypothetical protein